MNMNRITHPTLVLDPTRCQKNILRMIDKARNQNIVFRPHFKTHQSLEIGQWFSDQGVDQITVSSVGMANYFAKAGWKDITIAFPVNIRQLDEIKSLSAQLNLGLLVVDAESVNVLGKQLKSPVSIWIKVDVGTHRTGLGPEQTALANQIVERINQFPQLHFAGFLAHAGHTYQSRTHEEVQHIYDESLAIMINLKNRYLSTFPELKISLGDTPGSSIVEHFGAVDELRPGNFVFYDLMQTAIGACTYDDIAVAMACPVVAVHPERLQWIIYGGAVHFSKDFLTNENGTRCFGRLVLSTEQGWSCSDIASHPFLISLSQEHGIVQCDETNFHLCQPGDLSLWVPVHSCLTADAMGEYVSLDGSTVDHYRKRVFE